VTAAAFENRIALVTGASRGIGAALAYALAAHGAHVILTARTQGGLEHVEDRIHQAGGMATIAPLDLLQHDQIDRLGQIIARRWSKLDLLVMNAALLGPLTPLPHLAPADFDRVMATNLTANYRLLRIMDPLLRASPAAHVVALTSSVATAPRAYWGAYAASKAALEALVGCYADEVENLAAISCLIVDPGGTRTKMRATAFPGEDPLSLPEPENKAAQIVEYIKQSTKKRDRVILAQS
jgi:NAD(P)-dependent dehydrogenase (short-subunit alcohol dehydrogenase family)